MEKEPIKKQKPYIEEQFRFFTSALFIKMMQEVERKANETDLEHITRLSSVFENTINLSIRCGFEIGELEGRVAGYEVGMKEATDKILVKMN